MIYATGNHPTTHEGLVSRAVRWLRNTRGCGVVLTKGSVCVSEQPDAVGWKGNGTSVWLECKVSRSDFRADAEKSHRILASLDASQGIGNERWYLTRPCLLTLAEIPAGWGLIEAFPGINRVRLPAPWQALKNASAEISLLLAALRRENEVWEIELDAGCLPDVGL